MTIVFASLSPSMKQEFEWFFLVWSPTGPTPPRHRHDSIESAQKEAERLAREHGGSEFYVLKTMGKVVKSDVAWSIPVQPTEITF